MIKSEVGVVADSFAGSTPAPDFFRWEDAMQLLQGSRQVIRPSRIMDLECSREQIFMERPVIKRRKGDDKWRTSGGVKGGVEYWPEAGSVGVLKRYGRVVRAGLAPLKFAQYTLLTHDADADTEQTVGEAAALWVIPPFGLPASPQSGPNSTGSVHSNSSSPSPSYSSSPPAAMVSPSWGATGGDDGHRSILPETAGALEHCVQSGALAPHTVFSARSPGQAAVDLCSSHKFISFQSSHPDEEGIELGAVVRGVEGGVKLQGPQGDFAEYYRRAPGEKPFEEGDVVGFRNGTLTRRTDRCAMIGVVSRMAVVEGSAPPAEDRHLYDTVAHCGVVPVKLSLRRAARRIDCECPAPLTGQLLTPSGLHDGTAVLAPVTASYLPRVGVLLDDRLSETPEADGEEVGYRLVKAAVLAPPETMRGAAGWAAQARRAVSATVVLMVVFSIATLLVRQLLLTKTTDTGHDKAHAALHSSLKWDPPTLKNLTAICPAEVAACGLGGPSDQCQVISGKALHQRDVGVLFVDPGLVSRELAVLGCYFSRNPPPHSPWPPEVPDTMILHCGSRLQKCQDSDDCHKTLDAALDMTDPADLAVATPDLMPLVGCTFCASSIEWAAYPQLVNSMQVEGFGGPDSVPAAAGHSAVLGQS